MLTAYWDDLLVDRQNKTQDIDWAGQIMSLRLQFILFIWSGLYLFNCMNC